MKLLILDKDGTLIRPKEGQWVHEFTNQMLLPGVAETLAKYREDGWIMAIASNQGGVAHGYKTIDSMIDELIFAMGLTGIEYALAAHSNETEGYGEFYEFDLTDGKQHVLHMTCSSLRFRKPNPGMLKRIKKYHPSNSESQDWESILYVGDRPEDEQAAINAKIPFMTAEDWIRSL